MSLQIYRVTVRGFFTDLAPEVRERLVAEADAHDALDAAFTEAGTFTYDRAIRAFSHRIQVRVALDDGDERPVADATARDAGLAHATAELAARGIGFTRLRATATNMADVWA